MTQPKETKTTSSTLLSEKQYKLLKLSASVILPAIGFLYFGIAELWGLPRSTEVVGTIAAINVFLGTIMKGLEYIYDVTGAKFDGVVNVTQDPEDGHILFDLDVSKNPDALSRQPSIVFKVNNPQGL